MTSMLKMIGSKSMARLHLTMLKSAKQLATLDLEQWGHWNGHLGWKSCLSVNSTTDVIEHIYFHLSGAFTYIYIYKYTYICDIYIYIYEHIYIYIYICMIYALIIYVPCMYATILIHYTSLSKAQQLPTMILTTCGPTCINASSNEDTALSQDL